MKFMFPEGKFILPIMLQFVAAHEKHLQNMSDPQNAHQMFPVRIVVLEHQVLTCSCCSVALTYSICEKEKKIERGTEKHLYRDTQLCPSKDSEKGGVWNKDRVHTGPNCLPDNFFFFFFYSWFVHTHKPNLTRFPIPMPLCTPTRHPITWCPYLTASKPS